MLKDLIVNIAFITVFTFFFSHLFIKNRLVLDWKQKIVLGIVQGVFGTVLIYYGMRYSSTIIIDLRYIPVSVAASFGGFGAAGIAGAIMIVCRLCILPWSEASWSALVMLVLYVCGSVVIIRWIKYYWYRWIGFMVWLVAIMMSVGFFVLNMPLHILGIICAFNCLGGLIAAYLLSYLIRSEQLEQQIRSMQKGLQRLLRSQPGFTATVVRTDPGTYLYTLAEGQLLSEKGWKPEDFEGKTLDEITVLSITEQEYVRACFDRVFQGEMVTYEPGIKESGILITMQPVYEKGEVGEIIISGMDLTDRKQKEEADEANKAKSRFLARMSHEIRTPINAIIGLNYLLQQTTLHETQQDYVSKSIMSAKNLLHIVNDILDFSKIEAEKVELEKIDFDLYQVINEISNIISLKAFEKNLKLRCHIHHAVPNRLRGDPFRLNQILLNFTNNAVKFTENGEVSISVGLESIGEHGVRLRFSVRDTGIGMTEAQQSNLLQEFTQADMSTTRKYGGTGLGLVISKNLIELMGGELHIESEIGRGSCFTFTAEFDGSGKTSSGKEKESPRQNLRVLLLCDDDEMKLVLNNQLEKFASAVVIADSQNADHEGYDLVIIDWKLKTANVIQLADRMRRASLSSKRPIILISAYYDRQLQHPEYLTAFDKVLQYPLSQSSLYRELNALLLPESKGGEQEYKQADNFDLLQRAVVLLVEDNEINQLVASEVLKDAGMIVEVADNGEEAVKLASLKRYDAILMDLQMPVMDGVEATKRIRRMDHASHTPIIAMTADAMKGVHEQVIEAGMDAYITKPFDRIQLFGVLQRLIQKAI
ncbi:response regulator [Cohnella yongneupensis]|uniref:histidine kinase n=1 Tax=Cohnella yongneupensis TaxID=425006 RepID=A0ABW0R539_9BACL